MCGEEDEGERVKVELRRQSSAEEGWDTGSDSGGEREEGGGVNTGTPCRPNGRQELAHSPVRRPT